METFDLSVLSDEQLTSLQEEIREEQKQRIRQENPAITNFRLALEMAGIGRPEMTEEPEEPTSSLPTARESFNRILWYDPEEIDYPDEFFSSDAPEEEQETPPEERYAPAQHAHHCPNCSKTFMVCGSTLREEEVTKEEKATLAELLSLHQGDPEALKREVEDKLSRFVYQHWHASGDMYGLLTVICLEEVAGNTVTEQCPKCDYDERRWL